MARAPQKKLPDSYWNAWKQLRIVLGFRIVISAFFGYWLLRCFFWVNRRTVLNGERLNKAVSSGRPVLICCWHGRLLFPVFQWNRHNYYALAGLNKDAEIISKIATKLGWKMLRGSGSRGGSKAYMEMIRALNDGGKLFITPDGSQGPEYEVKEGAIKSALRTEAIMVPVSGQASRAWKIRNWDMFVIPKPFGRIVHVVGDPVDVQDLAEGDSVRDAITAGMIKAQEEADAWING